MDRTDWFLALILYLLAIIALETVSSATNELFSEIGGGISLLVITLLPVYLLIQAILDQTKD